MAGKYSAPVVLAMDLAPNGTARENGSGCPENIGSIWKKMTNSISKSEV
jgi:hypothetical protein